MVDVVSEGSGGAGESLGRSGRGGGGRALGRRLVRSSDPAGRGGGQQH